MWQNIYNIGLIPGSRKIAPVKRVNICVVWHHGEFMGKMFHMLKADQSLTGEAGVQDLQALVADLSARNSALLEKVRRLEVLCDQDAALQILNRRGLTAALQRSLVDCERHGIVSAFIYIDLDNFKPVNDRYGHARGDHILKKLAEHIRKRLRCSDHFGRLGGDEFGIILSHATCDQAELKIHELARSVAIATAGWGPGAENLSFSAGVSEIRAGRTVRRIMEMADKNMYRNKARKSRGTQSRSDKVHMTT